MQLWRARWLKRMALSTSGCLVVNLRSPSQSPCTWPSCWRLTKIGVSVFLSLDSISPSLVSPMPGSFTAKWATNFAAGRRVGGWNFSCAALPSESTALVPVAFALAKDNPVFPFRLGAETVRKRKVETDVHPRKGFVDAFPLDRPGTPAGCGGHPSIDAGQQRNLVDFGCHIHAVTVPVMRN